MDKKRTTRERNIESRWKTAVKCKRYVLLGKTVPEIKVPEREGWKYFEVYSDDKCGSVLLDFYATEKA